MAFTREAEPIAAAFDSVFQVVSRPFGHLFGSLRAFQEPWAVHPNT